MRIESPEALGSAIKRMREQLGLTQSDLAMTAGTGVRFIVDVEKGKGTSQVGKVIRLLMTLGAVLEIKPPLGVRLGQDPSSTGRSNGV